MYNLLPVTGKQSIRPHCTNLPPCTLGVCTGAASEAPWDRPWGAMAEAKVKKAKTRDWGEWHEEKGDAKTRDWGEWHEEKGDEDDWHEDKGHKDKKNFWEGKDWKKADWDEWEEEPDRLHMPYEEGDKDKGDESAASTQLADWQKPLRKQDDPVGDAKRAEKRQLKLAKSKAKKKAKEKAKKVSFQEAKADDDAAMKEQQEANEAAMEEDGASDVESVASEAASMASKASKASAASKDSDLSGVTESLADCDLASDVGSVASTAASASVARRHLERIRAGYTQQRQEENRWVHVDVSEATPRADLHQVANRWTGAITEKREGRLTLKRRAPTCDQIKLVKNVKYEFHDEEAAKVIGDTFSYVEDKDHTCSECSEEQRCQELFADVVEWPWTGPGKFPQYCYPCFNKLAQEEWLHSLERIKDLPGFKDRENGSFPVSKQFFHKLCNKQWQRKKNFDKGHMRLRSRNWVNMTELLNCIEELHPLTKDLSQTQKRKYMIFHSWDLANRFMKTWERLSPEKQAQIDEVGNKASQRAEFLVNNPDCILVEDDFEEIFNVHKVVDHLSYFCDGVLQVYLCRHASCGNILNNASWCSTVPRGYKFMCPFCFELYKGNAHANHSEDGYRLIPARQVFVMNDPNDPDGEPTYLYTEWPDKVSECQIDEYKMIMNNVTEAYKEGGWPAIMSRMLVEGKKQYHSSWKWQPWTLAHKVRLSAANQKLQARSSKKYHIYTDEVIEADGGYYHTRKPFSDAQLDLLHVMQPKDIMHMFCLTQFLIHRAKKTKEGDTSCTPQSCEVEFAKYMRKSFPS